MKLVIGTFDYLLGLSALVAPIILAFSYMCFIFSWRSLILFLGIATFSVFIYYSCKIYHDIKQQLELWTFTNEYTNYSLKEISLSEMFSDKELDEMKGMLRLYKNPLFYCFIASLEDRKVRKRFSGFKVFPSYLGYSVIIISENPSEMSINNKFALFHEMGHMSKAHSDIVSLKGIVFGNYLLFLFISSLIVTNPIILSIAFAVSTYFYLHMYRKYEYAKSRFESVATFFPMAMLRDEPNTAPFFENVFSNDKIILPEIVPYCKEWLNEYYNMDEITKPLDFVLKKSDSLRYTLTDKAVNYHTFIENLTWPSLLPVVLINITGIICGYYGNHSLPLISIIPIYVFLACIIVWTCSCYQVYRCNCIGKCVQRILKRQASE